MDSHIDPLLGEVNLNIENQVPEVTVSTTNPEEASQHRTIKICDFIKKLGLTPKEFFQNLLDSSKEEIASRRQFWGTPTGWDSTANLILSIKKRAIESDRKANTQRWSDFILRQVSLIQQHPKIDWNSY